MGTLYIEDMMMDARSRGDDELVSQMRSIGNDLRSIVARTGEDADMSPELNRLPPERRDAILEALGIVPDEPGTAVAVATPPTPPILNQSFRVQPFREARQSQPLQPLWALLAAAGAGSAAAGRLPEERR
jgi:hypothetical protein